MRKITKLINFFISDYYSNPKYKHSIYSFLKFFYERSNKTMGLYSSVSNIFKNSKWTNYRIQNIKNSFQSRIPKLLLTVIVFVIIFLNYKHFIFPIVELVYNILFFVLKDLLYDNVSLAVSVLVTFVYSVKIYICNYFIFLLTPNSKIKFTYREKLKSHYIKQNKIKIPFININEAFLTTNYVNSMSLLFKLKNNFYWLNLYNEITQKNIFKVMFNRLFILDNKIITTKNLEKTPINYSFNFKNQCFYPYNYTTYIENTSTVAKINLFKNFNSNFFKPVAFENILISSLNVLKQTRWITRNLVLSDKFMLNTNFFTEYKKMIGDNVTVSNLPNINVWASSNIPKIWNAQKLLTVLLSHESNFYLNGLVNDFDESRLWLFKKMYFNTVIRHISTVASSNVYHSTNLKSSNKHSRMQTEYLSKSLPHNLLFLNNTQPHVHTNSISRVVYLDNINSVSNSLNYNLLSDSNIDILVSSFIHSNIEFHMCHFYSNLCESANNDTDFNLTYRK